MIRDGPLDPNTAAASKDERAPVSATRSAMLIGFDWCGKDGESLYPPPDDLDDTERNLWHKDVQWGNVMRKEHDEFLLERLRNGTDFVAL